VAIFGAPMAHGKTSLNGKRLHNELERSTMFNGKTHYFDWAIFNSNVTNYQRVIPTGHITPWHSPKTPRLRRLRGGRHHRGDDFVAPKGH